MLSVKKIVWFLTVIEILVLGGMAYRLFFGASVTVRFSADTAGCMEVFYARNSGFTAKQRETVLFGYGNNALTVALPRGKYNTLRLDPGYLSGCRFTIFEVVYQPHDFARFVIPGDALARCPSGGIAPLTPETPGTFHFETRNNDPQIILDLRNLSAQRVFPLYWAMLIAIAVLTAILLALTVVFRKAVAARCDAFNRKIAAWEEKHPRAHRVLGSGYCWWWALFALCVTCGFTFASLGMVRTFCEVSLRGETKLLGHYRQVRTDEFACRLLPSIEQFHHGFPRISTNKGLSGRNYLMFHNTGVPVLHPAALARPATWGYFLFDLRRGISWHSMFPVFFAVFAFWFFLNTLCPENGAWNFVFALAAVFVPTSAMWSFWPAYDSAGFFLAAGAAVHLLQAKSRRGALLWGTLAGWAGAVGALCIYFPWIWPAALLAFLMLLGWAVPNRRTLVSGWGCKLCGLLLAGVIVLFFVAVWYLAVRDLIPIVMNSVYPGKRFVAGGHLKWWTLFIGYLSPIYTGAAGLHPANDCEAQSPMMLLAIFPVLIFYWKTLQKRWPVVLAVLFLGFTLFYMYFGFSPAFAKITLFNRCTEWRCFQSVSLILILLCAFLFSARKLELKHPEYLVFLNTVLAVVPLLVLLNASDYAVAVLRDPAYRKSCYAILLIYLFIASVFPLNHRLGIAAYVFGLIASGIWFNPLCIAPTKVEMPLFTAASREKAQWGFEGRTLFMSNFVEPNLYAAVGGKSFNGHFLPEDPVIFDLVLKDLPKPERFHRQNHFWVKGMPEEAPLRNARIPSYPGGIYLELNAVRYDFSQLPIDYVVTNERNCAKLLVRNPRLRELPRCGEWRRFQVLHGELRR